MLKRSSPRNCNDIYHRSRLCRAPNSEKVKSDKLLRKSSQETAKWQFSLVEALPSSKFWKSGNGAISWTEENLWLNFAIFWFKFWKKWDYLRFCRKSSPNWDCPSDCRAEVQILKKMRLLQNDIYHRSRFCRAPNSEKVQMALSLELSGIFW